MKKSFKALERKQLLKRLDSLASLPTSYQAPPEGWIRPVRKALGMTASQLAKRLGVQQSRVSEIEKGEIHHQLTLKTLMATAQALGCRFEYAFIPEKPVELLLKERALAVARDKVGYISHHMALEDQSLSEKEQEEQIKQLAEELLKKPQTLWDS
ncbi:MAG: mobile mystery protein A [Alphaproteobacteria bacterium]|nr:mobile mystery protein A [Alphaproteobacteria bacterium]